MSEVILVVEDDAAILAGLIDLLEGEGYSRACDSENNRQ